MLAIAYKEWLDKIESENRDHPGYNSSSGEFYLDIVSNLLWIQKGLCAYTEHFLCDHSQLGPEQWKDGRYGQSKYGFLGQLEHYDESLKPAKGWLWSNFFVVDTDINAKNKKRRPVKYALKPDADNYDPFFLLQYDIRTHHFLPNENRDISLQENILHDINVLGLNFQPIITDRREILNPLIEEVKYKRKTIEEARLSLREYFTAFEMMLQSLV